MDRETFWAIIEKARTKAKNADDWMLRLVADAIKPLGASEVAEFQRHLDECMNEAYTWPLWGAGHIINEGCSDDGFEYFRALLIANGREVFEAAVKDPDSLAGAKLKFGFARDRTFETFLYVPAEVHAEIAKGKKVPRVKGREEPAGVQWTEDDLPALLPLLAKKYKLANPKKIEIDLEAGDVFRIPLAKGSREYAYYKVLGRGKGMDGWYTLIALLDYPPPNEKVLADWSSVPHLGIRLQDPYRPNMRLRAGGPWDWSGYGKVKKIKEVVGRVEVTEEERDLPPQMFYWQDAVANAVHSFDRTEWPTGEQVVERLRTMPLKQLESPSEALVKELTGVQVWHSMLHQAGTEFIHKHREFERAAATLRLAVRITPEQHAEWLWLGSVLTALGNVEEGERAWARAVEHAPKKYRPGVQETVDRHRASIKADGLKCKAFESMRAAVLEE